MATERSAVEARNVTKIFGSGPDAVRALDNVSIQIRENEFFTLLGPSGCGKTTLLRLIAGFELPTEGEILLDGDRVGHLPPNKRLVNTVFQSYALFPHMTVWDNIAFGLRRDGLPKAEIDKRVDEMLRLVQLAKLARRKPHQLSGGQQQRVALARSLAKRPLLLLLDEPLGALDKKLREATQIELVNIIESVGVTCVMVTHDQEEAMTMASRIAVMSEGRFLQVGSPADIYETPTTRFVADFIGNVNLTDGRITVDEADHVHVQCADFTHYIGHGITGYLGQAVTVAVRPEKVSLSRDKPAGDMNQVHGTVKEMSYFGDTTLYHLELPSGARFKVTVENDSRDRSGAPTWGDRVWAHWQPTAQVVLTQ